MRIDSHYIVIVIVSVAEGLGRRVVWGWCGGALEWESGRARC